MSLLKRGGVWWAYLYRDGIRHQFSTGTGNRKRAEKIAAKFKEELNDQRFGIVDADPHITFLEIAARFLASGSVRPHHKYHLQFLEPFFGEYPALRITKSLADEYRRARQMRDPKHPVKDSTINRDLSVIRHILYWAVDEQIIAANPLARMRMARERRTRRQVLSVAEEELLLGVAKGHLRTMTIIALDTGMRRGEITGQRWDDVDFAQGVLYVTRSKTPEGESREIPLTNRLRELLLSDHKSNGLIITFRDKPVRIIKRAWKTALKHAGIRHVRFHDLRHTFNTRLMEAGVLQEVRMALMGHSAGSKVHAIYTHIELPVKREAIRKLEAWKINQHNLLREQRTKEEEVNGQENSSAGESASIIGGNIQTQAVEEEDSGRDRSRASRQAARGDRRGGAAPQSEKEAAPEI